MQVGDILEMEPTMEGTSGLGTDGPQRCTVMWIHPDKRFLWWSSAAALTGRLGGRRCIFRWLPMSRSSAALDSISGWTSDRLGERERIEE